MNQSKKNEPEFSKMLARKGYAERQFDKWVKWSFNNYGRILFKDVIKKQVEYKIIKDL